MQNPTRPAKASLIFPFSASACAAAPEHPGGQPEKSSAFRKGISVCAVAGTLCSLLRFGTSGKASAESFDHFPPRRPYRSHGPGASVKSPAVTSLTVIVCHTWTKIASPGIPKKKEGRISPPSVFVLYNLFSVLPSAHKTHCTRGHCPPACWPEYDFPLQERIRDSFSRCPCSALPPGRCPLWNQKAAPGCPRFR